MSAAEIRERQRLTARLMEASLGLDVDGLRLVVCVALIRGLDGGQLDALNAAILSGRGHCAPKEET